ncbi:choice-of-anchor Q domain-containing protein [Candidatus Parabeggiatoa sp. HSG14]|uniref:choice-of-anchor Q domain-containing protein n=1 Tax=Candidatus Parabeggiatoa sp. HSG14 TaxID=3055593 RepID=UPI0025A86D80|nr:choice-of-anchor Q domain-containing protein [Thiotrichales bacterium HSG14]
MKTIIFLISITFLLASHIIFAACPSSNIAYVDISATGINDGTDWTNAFTDLQSAISTGYLTTCTSVTEIHVAQGTYVPGTLRTDTFQLVDNLAIYGGYPTGGGVRDSDPATNNTILSGDIGTIGTHGDNSYHIVTTSFTNNTAILDGFIIEFGRAIKRGRGVCNKNYEGRCGAGILNVKGKPILANLILRKNRALQAGGGMVNLKSGTNPTLDNVSFIRNIASVYGGGIFNQTGNLTISNAVFQGNKANGKGGGVHINGGTHTLTNVIFSGNKAVDGGGLWNQNATLSTLTNVTFSGNEFRGITNKSSSLILSNVILWDNVTQEIDNNSIVKVNNSIIKGSSGSSWWTSKGITDNGSNLDSDPLFVTPVTGKIPNTRGDLHLSSGSPAIDVGTNTNCLSADLEGVVRPQNGTCDIGAYEFTLSPTVQLPEDIVLGDGIKQPADINNPTMEDFGLDSERIAELDGKQIKKLEPAVFNTFDAEAVEQIPIEAFSAMDVEQMAQFTPEALDGLSVEQFKRLPLEALGGLTSENMGGLPTNILSQLTPEHLAALNPVYFKQQPTQNISKIFNNLDIAKVKNTDVMGLLPANWTINSKTGALTAPVGAKLALRNFKHPIDLPEQVALPKMPDLDTGFGIGGEGFNVQEGMNHSLATENLTDFILSQDDKGILNIVGMGNSARKKYTFIPDMDNIIQVKEIPVGLSVTEGGFYVITTPEQQQYRIIPTPQYPIALSKILGDGQVSIGKQGDVLLSYESSSVRRQELIHQVVIFDPFIEPIPEEFCEEIALEEFVCDFETALLEMQPGIHLPNNTRTKKSPQTGKVVYENGSSQIIKPTLLSPDIFIKEGLKFEGVESIVFNANGTFKVIHQGNPYLIVPNFKVEAQEVVESEKTSSIIANENGTLRYTVPLESKNVKTRREQEKIHQVLIFDPFIEPIPKDFCQEIFPGEYECDFEELFLELE